MACGSIAILPSLKPRTQVTFFFSANLVNWCRITKRTVPNFIVVIKKRSNFQLFPSFKYENEKNWIIVLIIIANNKIKKMNRRITEEGLGLVCFLLSFSWYWDAISFFMALGINQVTYSNRKLCRSFK